MFDLNESADVTTREDEGILVHLRDAAGEKMYADEAQEKPVTMRVAGTYSEVYRKAREANRDKQLKKRSPHLDGDQLEDAALDEIAACVLSWENLNAGGKPLPFSKHNAVVVLKKARFIREQVEAAMSDHAAFFKPASAT